MINAIRLGKPLQQPSLTSFSLSNSRRAPPSALRFLQAASGEEIMDSKKQSDPVESKTQDTMSSLGEGYATRSDDEGFGCIYGSKEKDDDKIVHELDHDQGSDVKVKEKEKGRNQNKDVAAG
ncbi:hypothetical protein C2S51_020875 [Perilla frutescens var. frutescens]|nr:hypothetical protein C2S51_020875 [Perilla frutescens var. frutescens]